MLWLLYSYPNLQYLQNYVAWIPRWIFALKCFSREKKRRVFGRLLTCLAEIWPWIDPPQLLPSIYKAECTHLRTYGELPIFHPINLWHWTLLKDHKSDIVFIKKNLYDSSEAGRPIKRPPHAIWHWLWEKEKIKLLRIRKDTAWAPSDEQLDFSRINWLT